MRKIICLLLFITIFLGACQSQEETPEDTELIREQKSADMLDCEQVQLEHNGTICNKGFALECICNTTKEPYSLVFSAQKEEILCKDGERYLANETMQCMRAYQDMLVLNAHNSTDLNVKLMPCRNAWIEEEKADCYWKLAIETKDITFCRRAVDSITLFEKGTYQDNYDACVQKVEHT